MIHRSTCFSDLENAALQFDHVDPLHRRNGGQPAGGAASPQTDHHRIFRMRMERSAYQTAHHLGPSIGLGVSVGFSVYDKRQAVGVSDRNAAFKSIDLPQNVTTGSLHELAQIVLRSGVLSQTTNTDLAVTPKCSWSSGEQ